MNELEEKTAVIILTSNYRITGYVHCLPSARLTDFIRESKSFIALTDVEIKTKQGNRILFAPFINVQRDDIEIIMPSEGATWD